MGWVKVTIFAIVSFLWDSTSLIWTVLLKKTVVIHQLQSCLSLSVVQDRKGDVTANEVADYDGIVVRLRGDGRTYTLNVQTKGIRDDDIHQSFFHTRGGPYWEIVRVRQTTSICCKRIARLQITIF